MNNSMKVLKGIGKTILALLIVCAIVVLVGAGTVMFMRWQRDAQEKNSGDKNALENLFTSEEKQLEPKVTCLFLGVNGSLTDFIMLGQYDPNTREIDLLSVPRDTNIGNLSPDGKLNSLYATKGMDALKKQITEITGIDIDYHILFKTKILRNVVNAIGGVNIDVPINMNYDDPYQDLYIHLNKGPQKLTGAQAEQFCRFRHNSDGTGYADGDIGRTRAQQQFVKAFIAELLKPTNISKLPDVAKIVIDGTKTNVTMDVAKEYLDDVIALRTDRIKTNTLPGVGRYEVSPYGYKLSYFFVDEVKAKIMIDEMFHGKVTTEGDLINASSTNLITKDQSGEQVVRVELLNAGTSTKTINDLVDKLKAKNFYVVKIGNYETTKKENSKIIDYGNGTDAKLNELKQLLGITKVETSSDNVNVVYTVMVGPYYEK